MQVKVNQKTGVMVLVGVAHFGTVHRVATMKVGVDDREVVQGPQFEIHARHHTHHHETWMTVMQADAVMMGARPHVLAVSPRYSMAVVTVTMSWAGVAESATRLKLIPEHDVCCVAVPLL